MFAVTAGYKPDELAKKYESENDDYNAIMIKIIADRLAEAAAEWLHELVRKYEWGYAKHENFDINQLNNEEYLGIRPAPGYPSCPDHNLKDIIWDMLEVEKRIGITLTQSKAMNPAASVCGFYFAHPKSKYFSVLKNNHNEI